MDIKLNGRINNTTPGTQFYEAEPDGATAQGAIWVMPGGRPYSATLFNYNAAEALVVEVTTDPLDMVEALTATYLVLAGVAPTALEVDAGGLSEVMGTAMRFSYSSTQGKVVLAVAVRL